MKKWIKSNWKRFSVFGIVGFVGVPMLINTLFKVDFGLELFRAEWEAGDVLSFYGMILASVLTVYGVYLSIDYSKKNYRDDLRNQVLPFFSIYNLKTKSKRNWRFPNNSNVITGEKLSIEGYQEYKIKDYCYILENGKIDIRDGLSDKQKDLLDNSGLRWLINDGSAACEALNPMCHPMEMENVGNGPAISFRIGFNRKNTPEIEKMYAYPIPIKVGEKIMVHIFSEDCGKNSANLGDYILDMYYKDIYGNEYAQKHDVSIEYSDEFESPMISILYEEKQILCSMCHDAQRNE